MPLYLIQLESIIKHYPMMETMIFHIGYAPAMITKDLYAKLFSLAILKQLWSCALSLAAMQMQSS